MTNLYDEPTIDKLLAALDARDERIRELEQRVTRQAATVQARQESWHEMKQQLKAAQDAANYMHRSYHTIIDGECSYCEYFGPTREFRGRQS